MSQDDSFEEILRAFVGELPDEITSEELDQLYSEAVADGMVREEDLERSFEQFLNRRVEKDPRTGRLALKPREQTVGEYVEAYRRSRELTPKRLAEMIGIGVGDVRAIERSDERYDRDRLSQIAVEVANHVQGLAPAKVRRLLQQIRVEAEIRTASGPALKAARRRPGE